jgi:uncharacterized protein (TIGR02147 family)
MGKARIAGVIADTTFLKNTVTSLPFLGILFGMDIAEPRLYDYYDYRKYLADYCEWRRSRQSWFSYRYLSGRIGIDHANFVRVLQGVRNFPVKKIPEAVKCLGLSSRQAQYFEMMVRFCSAKSNDEAKSVFEKMLGFTTVGTKVVDSGKFEFYRAWYYSAVRELLNIYEFKGDYTELGSLLRPPISPAEARQAVKLLEQLGFIEKNPHGVYELREKYIQTPQEWRGIAIHEFQKATIELAARALQDVPKDQRDISTLTLTIDENGLADIKELVKTFHQEAFKISERCKEEDQVVQINVQVFPLSQRIGRRVK